MSPDRERRRQLEVAAEEVFAALFPEDHAALLARYGSRSRLRDGAVELADKVAGRFVKTADPVRPPEYALLVAACLTWGRSGAGFAQNIAHATKKFQRYRRFVELPLGILGRTDRLVGDDEQVIGLLAASLRVRTGVTGARPDGEPELILNAVVPAIVAALGRSDPAAGTDLVRTALEVLERAAGLAAEYRVARRPVPVVGTDLPVAGNADFLVWIAAYRVAIEERRGLIVTRPLDGLEQAVADLASILRKAMTRPAARWGRRGSDEPDVATAINQYASYLGSAAGNDSVRRRVCGVHSVLNYRLGLDEPSCEIPDDPGDWIAPSTEVAEHLPEVQQLVGWLIATLFQGACKGAQEALLEWLNGKDLTDQQKHLPLLVRRLRVAVNKLDGPLEGRPPRPAGVTPSQLNALSARLAAAVDPDEIHGCERADARRVTLAALPPLWTRRCPAILLLAAHLRVLIGPKNSGHRKAMLVAAHGVRAPVQFVQPSTNPLRVPCCPDAGAAGRSAAGGRPREPVHYEEICPHRPWGEIGWVENYYSLGKAANCRPDAARKQLKRYQGPWPELLWY